MLPDHGKLAASEQAQLETQRILAKAIARFVVKAREVKSDQMKALAAKSWLAMVKAQEPVICQEA